MRYVAIVASLAGTLVFALLIPFGSLFRSRSAPWRARSASGIFGRPSTGWEGAQSSGQTW